MCIRDRSGTGRAEIANAADAVAEHLRGDKDVYENPDKYFDEVIEINLDELEPHINGPFTPDLAWPLSKFAQAVKENGWPSTLDVGLIGSCTNSSYEDIMRAASLAKQAVEAGIKAKSEFTITPGSEQVRFTVERDGFLGTFEKMGGVVLANACGPCIGQWARHTSDPNRKNSIITSFNRNFAKRNDGNANTHAFVASPEIVTALAIAGDLTFNPMTDTLTNSKGEKIKLKAPEGLEAPARGYAVEDAGYQEPAKDGSKVSVLVSPTSDRLQLLDPFRAWEGTDLNGLKLLIKVKGKCTTDHISMAGPWLKFRGHLDNISNNMLIGAVNSFNDKTDCVKNQLSGEYGSVPAVQREYKTAGIGTIVVGDENYGDCLLYTSDAADERSSVDLGGRRIIKKKKQNKTKKKQKIQKKKTMSSTYEEHINRTGGKDSQSMSQSDSVQKAKTEGARVKKDNNRE